jgi:hypothetical protein
MRMRIRLFYPNADPDPDPSFQIKAQTLEKVLQKALIPHTLACHLQIYADPVQDPAYQLVADPYPYFYFIRIRILLNADPGYQNDVEPCGSGSSTLVPVIQTGI